ncbi:MAG TPA: CYTH and CHAD domain-containing protein [Burkholderiaceae bacterium]|nr:CYTH and CHAD domain-containing protein [Burkholderiaceae bacterium]
MLERELKFYVPPRRRSGLRQRLKKLGAAPISLHARYYDTANQALARAGIALRLRREGEVWIQTIKLPGPDELSRIEWNHPRPEAVLDLSVYEGTHINALLTELADRLVCRYITHVQRLKKEVPTPTGIVELAYDEGAIMAGGLALPIHELELEGISGDTSDLFELSREWLTEFQLILELRSKAARGDALAQLASGSKTGLQAIAELPESAGKPDKLPPLSEAHQRRIAAPVRNGQPVLAAEVSLGAAYLECANDCLNQVIRNSTFLAAVDGMKPSADQRIEYVHQVRVGMRRLRACWSLFGKAMYPPKPLRDELSETFRVFGQARDQDVIQSELLPRLVQAGMPPDDSFSQALSERGTRARSELAAQTPFQLLLLDLLEHLVLFGDNLAQNSRLGRPAAPILSKRLNKWLDDIRQKAPSFLEAGWDERHLMRKRVKRLRYSMEFAQGTLEPACLTPLRAALVSAQKALGQLNDIYVAAEYYRGAGAKHAAAMFALGWLAATQEHEVQSSYMALQTLAKAGNFIPASGKPRKRKSG